MKWNYVCWYCRFYTPDMYFSSEFDTPLHKDCLLEALFDDPSDPEMQILT